MKADTAVWLSKLAFWLVVIGFIALALTGCGGGQTVRTEERVQTATVSIPKAVRCPAFDEMPTRPVPTTVDVTKATTDQLAAAMAADAEAFKLYSETIEAIIAKCSEVKP